MPVLYEVNLAIDHAVLPRFEAWLAAHIAEMLDLGVFTDARWFDVEPDEETEEGRARRVVHYTAATRDDLERYFAEHAARMRTDGLQKFGGTFSATRRILHKRQASA